MKWTKTDGLIAATFTPLNQDGSLNLKLIEKYVEHLIKNGVKQVYVNGTSAECMSLSVQERKSIVEEWVKHGRAKLDRIIVHCGAGNLVDSKELASHSAKLGVDCIAAVGPTYFKPKNIAGLIDYCADIAATAPDVPFMYYHFPDRTGLHFKVHEFLRDAQNRIPNLIGVKFTSMDLYDATQSMLVCDKRFDVIIGADTIFLGAMAMGIKSSIGIAYGILGKPFNRLIRSFEKGDLETARAEQYKVQEFFRRTHNTGDVNELVATFKTVMKICDPSLDFGPARLPLQSLTKDQEKHLLDELTAMDFHKWIQ
jgi:N-acetylneuraminate lyase